MPKASDLKSGMVVQYKDAPYIVRKVQAHNPTARGAATLYKARLNHAVTGQKLDATSRATTCCRMWITRGATCSSSTAMPTG